MMAIDRWLETAYGFGTFMTVTGISGTVASIKVKSRASRGTPTPASTLTPASAPTPARIRPVRSACRPHHLAAGRNLVSPCKDCPFRSA